MLIKQLSIFVENKLGRLAEVTKILAVAKIDISALVISDTTDFGVLRLIVNDTEGAHNILKENGFTVRLTDVVAVSISDETGSLSTVLEVLDKEAIEIEYMYAFLGRKIGESPAVFRFEDANKAVEVLQKNNIKVLTEQQL
ncbi:MAG: hypothetical protein H7Y18_02335 [Clostridiaceae bacterium]|nr:hypothetical protein [Clostridiaceae bacterium]